MTAAGSAQPSTLQGMVKWVSAFRLSSEKQQWWIQYYSCLFRWTGGLVVQSVAVQWWTKALCWKEQVDTNVCSNVMVLGHQGCCHLLWGTVSTMIPVGSCSLLVANWAWRWSAWSGVLTMLKNWIRSAPDRQAKKLAIINSFCIVTDYNKTVRLSRVSVMLLIFCMFAPFPLSLLL